MSCHSIVYVSEATVNLSEQALRLLLRQARAEHQQAQLTGVLVYCEGRFLQIIEGEEALLREFFDRVASDPRHCKLQKLADGLRPECDFADWYMSFVSANPAQAAQLPHYLTLPQLLEKIEGTSVQHLVREFLAESRVPLP